MNKYKLDLALVETKIIVISLGLTDLRKLVPMRRRPQSRNFWNRLKARHLSPGIVFQHTGEKTIKKTTKCAAGRFYLFVLFAVKNGHVVLVNATAVKLAATAAAAAIIMLHRRLANDSLRTVGAVRRRVHRHGNTHGFRPGDFQQKNVTQ